MSVINNPNNPGTSCGFQRDYLNLSGGINFLGLPDFLFDYKFSLMGGSEWVCEGDSILLYADSITNAVYRWTGPNSFSSNLRNPFKVSARLIDSGYYRLRITNITDPYDDSIIVRVYPAINASITNIGDTDLCKSKSRVLEANPTGSGIYYLWSTGETTRRITINKIGTYSVRVFNDGGCSDSVSITVRQDSSFQIASIRFLGDSVICRGNPVVLEALPDAVGLRYRWSTGDSTKIIHAKSAVNYYVIITNEAGCSDTAYISVKKDSSFVAAIMGNNYFCVGDSTKITAFPTDSIYRYKWSTGDTAKSIYVKTQGTYTLIVRSPLGCLDSASINITQVTKPAFKIVTLGKSTICHGDSVAVMVQGEGSGCSYKWSNGDTTKTTVVKSEGFYSVTVTNRGDCSTTDSIRINEYPLMNVGITANGPTTFCTGDSVVLTGTPYGKGYYCQWSTGAITQSIVVKSTGNYIYSVINSNVCTEKDSIIVTVAAELTASIKGENKICSGDSALLV